MITTIGTHALAIAVATMVALGGSWALIRAVAWAVSGRPAPVPARAPFRVGLDTAGGLWIVAQVDATTARLYHNNTVWVESLGVQTLRTLTTRYGITWQ